LEAFLRAAVGDEVYERLDPELRERMLGNADTFFGMEFGTFEEFVPAEAALAAVRVPVRVLVGRDTAPLFRESCSWLAECVETEVREFPGAHVPYLDRPEETAGALRQLLRGLA
jgi:pimeloyl-ACP methyl ester carboxylesterase